jgi:type IV pilus assembly protein PilQ
MIGNEGFTMNKTRFVNALRPAHRMRSLAAGLALIVASLGATAANVLNDVNYSPLPGGDVEIVIRAAESLGDPQIFATDSPPRIAIDFQDMKLGAVNRTMVVGAGATKNVSLVEAGGRTRLVVDLFRTAGYQTFVEGNTLRLVVQNGVASADSRAASSGLNVSNIDFRRGKNGEGRLIVSFNGDGAQTSLRKDGGKFTIDIPNARLGEGLSQRYDVEDFATAVESIEARNTATGTSLTVNAALGSVPLAYQAGSEYVLEVAVTSAAEDKVKKALSAPVYTGEKVTFNFQDIPVRSLLQLIADVAQQNIAVADSVSGNVTLRLVEVPWDQALDIVLQAKGLDKRKNGSVIWVAPTKEIADREQALEDARIALEERAPIISDYIAINYGKAEDIAKLLTSESLRGQGGGTQNSGQGTSGFLSNRGSLSFDERTNTLLVSDTAKRVTSVREIVTLLDRPVEQVLIESRIVVATETFRNELGARFGISGAVEDGDANVISIGGSLGATDALSNNALANRLLNRPSAMPAGLPGTPGSGIATPALSNRLNVNLPVASPAGSFGLTVLGGDYLLDLELSALEADQRGEVISTPRVITASQREAVIAQGNEIPYTTVNIDQNTGAVTSSVAFKPVVLELRVTPTISPDQRVFLNLNVKQDSVSSFAVNGQPAINTRNVNTAVLVDNGQTVVLGGILERETRDDKTQVPLLGDIPALGNLFKNKIKSDGKRELLIFVTPKILNSSLR